MLRQRNDISALLTVGAVSIRQTSKPLAHAAGYGGTASRLPADLIFLRLPVEYLTQ